MEMKLFSVVIVFLILILLLSGCTETKYVNQTILATQTVFTSSTSTVTLPRVTDTITLPPQLITVQVSNSNTTDTITMTDIVTKTISNDYTQVINASETIDKFLSYAISENYQQMWDMLHIDSQNYFSGEGDFESNNNIAPKDGLYLIDSYYIGQGQLLNTWDSYSNVVEIQVVIVSDKNVLADFILGLIPLIGDILTSTPDTSIAVWDAHCVLVDNQWKIFCERNSSAPQYTETTTTTTAITTPVPGSLQVTAQQLYLDYQNDPQGADLKYTGKTIWVTGVVDLSDYYFLLRITLDEFVFCYLADDNLVSSLVTGQTITLQGYCIGENWLNTNVILEDCILIS